MLPAWLSAVLAVVAAAGVPAGWWLGRRGRAASAGKDEADAAESLTASVVQLGQRLDQVSTALWDAQTRLALSEQRAVAAEQRAATAELRAATAEQRAAVSDAELTRLRAEVDWMRVELARYESTATEQRAA